MNTIKTKVNLVCGSEVSEVYISFPELVLALVSFIHVGVNVTRITLSTFAVYGRCLVSQCSVLFSKTYFRFANQFNAIRIRSGAFVDEPF